MAKPIAVAVFCLALLASSDAFAKDVNVDIKKISDASIGDKIGEVSVSESGKGLTLKVAVTGIPAGEHGFHIHEKGDCGPGTKDGKMAAGIAAGDHYDPESTKSHRGPHGGGHKGDLPKLTASGDGINQTVEAPALRLSDIEGRALVIHEGGDTYSDQPESGGGKGRIACGVVPKT